MSLLGVNYDAVRRPARAGSTPRGAAPRRKIDNRSRSPPVLHLLSISFLSEREQRHQAFPSMSDSHDASYTTWPACAWAAAASFSTSSMAFTRSSGGANVKKVTG